MKRRVEEEREGGKHPSTVLPDFFILSFLVPLSLSSLHKAVEDFDGQLSAGGRSSQLVKAVDSRLRKQIQELHIRCGKVRGQLVVFSPPLTLH